MMMKRRGFTVIELLTAVGVIAVLVALLFPAFRSSVKDARASVCTNNLKQIGAAIALYCGDNNNEIPYDMPGGSVTWVQTLTSYLEPQKSFPAGWAPAVVGKRPEGVWACPESKAVTKSGSYSDYSKNSCLNISLAPGPSTEAHAGYRLSSLPAPGRVFAISEGGDGVNCGRGLGPWVSPNNSGIQPRHNGRANVLFYDFHVESIDPTKLPGRSYDADNNPPWKPFPRVN